MQNQDPPYSVAAREAFEEARNLVTNDRNSKTQRAYLMILHEYSEKLARAAIFRLSPPTNVPDPDVQEPFCLFMGHDSSKASHGMLPDLRLAAKNFCEDFARHASDLPSTKVKWWSGPHIDDDRTLLQINSNPLDMQIVLHRMALEKAPHAVPILNSAAVLVERAHNYIPARKMN